MWTTIKLSDVLKTGSGGTPLKSKKEFYENGNISWLQSGAVSEKEILKSTTFITEAGLRNSSAKIFPPNTVLIAMYGATAGQVGILRFPSATNQAICGIYPSEKYLPEFLYYFLENYKDRLLLERSGVAQPNLSQIKIKNIQIPVLSILEQQRIVAKLEAAFSILEKVIHDQKKKLEEIKELEQNVFEKWFNNNNFKQYSLKEVCTFVGGSQPPKSTFQNVKNEENIRLIQIRDYKSDKNIVYIPIERARRFCSSSDVMIGRYGPPIFQILRGLDGAYNVALMKAVPKENIMNDYLFYFLKNRRIQKYVIDKSTRAAGQTGVNKDSLEPYPINLPSLEIQKNILKKAEKFNKHISILLNLGQEKIRQLLLFRCAILSNQMQKR